MGSCKSSSIDFAVENINNRRDRASMLHRFAGVVSNSKTDTARRQREATSLRAGGRVFRHTSGDLSIFGNMSRINNADVAE